MNARILAIAALLAAVVPSAALADETPATAAVAIAQPAATPKPFDHQALRLENALLVEQLADVFTTQLFLADYGHPAPADACHPANAECKWHPFEANPLAQPFTRKAWLNYASALALNTGVRFIPAGAAKTTALKVAVYAYPALLGWNASLVVKVGAR